MDTLQSQGNTGTGERAEALAELGPWFHNLHLPDGTETAPEHPLGDFPAFKWRELADALPEEMTGMRVLDIGCNAGFYSFELARRGADVLGVDIDEHYLRQARWARDQFEFGELIDFRQMQVYELHRLQETFDVVLFMGVFYHLRYPTLALDMVANCTEETLVFQSLMLPGEMVEKTPTDLSLDEREHLHRRGWPKMAFVEREFEGDPTNWWIPNHAAVLAMMRDAGFEVVERPGHEMYVCRHSDEREAKSRRNPDELEAVIGDCE